MRRLFVIAAAVVGAAVPAAADAVTYAPVDQPGPDLTVSNDKLVAALKCSGKLDNASTTPVLFTPATGATPEQNYAANYEAQFTKLGIPYCDVTLPENTTADIQTAAEYVVYGIRTMRARAGRRISMIGHSQGGMIPRWAFRFWPDLRPMVDDQIGFAPTNHGTTQSSVNNPNAPEANIQQAPDSEFTKALNSYKETFAGISYTAVYTRNDEVATPNQDAQTGTSALRTGEGRITNVAIQDICPADLSEHLTIGTIDNVAYELAIDALTHEGPASPSRVPAETCSQPFMPGARDKPIEGVIQALLVIPGQLSVTGVGGRNVSKEPALKCYVTVECSGAPAGATTCKSGRRVKIRVGRGARVTVDGRRTRVRGGYVRVDLRGKRKRTVLVRIKRPGRKTHTRRFKACVSGAR